VIRELKLTEGLTRQYGVRPAHLRDLGRVVVLAGPNGAGKTRYLRLVSQAASRLNPGEPGGSRTSAEQARAAAARSTDPAERDRLLASAKQLQEQADRFQAAQDAIDPDTRKLIKGVAGIWNTAAPIRARGELKEGEADSVVAQVSQPSAVGFHSAMSAIDAHCLVVAKAMTNADHPRLKDRPSVQKATEWAGEFVRIVKALLHMTLGADLDVMNRVVPTLDGRLLDVVGELSEGQRILLGWAVMLHQQVSTLPDCIIIIDEPENHLHPDVCIAAIRSLERLVSAGSGQIWLATHSVPLIASFSLASTYLVDGGEIAYGGNRASELVSRLLGGEENKRALQRILFDVDDLAFHEFAAQCLLAPHVATHKSGDKQEMLFQRIVGQGLSPGKTLRVLDYGAGRGRMAAAIVELLRSRPSSDFGLAYTAYNPNDESPAVQDECRRVVADLAQLPSVSARYITDVRAAQPPTCQPFDIAIVCNVMHEVHPSEWRRIFRELHDSVGEGGVALVMEDQQMSVGEMPHKDGFLVLDVFQMRMLLGAPESDVRALEHEHADRVSVIELPRRVLKRHSDLHLKETCEDVSKQAMDAARKLRQDGALDWRTGRRHAFLAMLALNAQLCRESLG